MCPVTKFFLFTFIKQLHTTFMPFERTHSYPSSCGTFGDVKSCLSRGETETWELSVTVCQLSLLPWGLLVVYAEDCMVWTGGHLGLFAWGVYHRNAPNKSLVCLWLTHLLSHTLLVIQPCFSCIPHYTSPLNSFTSVYPHTSGTIKLPHHYVFFCRAFPLPLTV